MTYNIAQLKADIEIIKQEIRYARTERATHQELELLYHALEDLQIQLFNATKELL